MSCSIFGVKEACCELVVSEWVGAYLVLERHVVNWWWVSEWVGAYLVFGFLIILCSSATDCLVTPFHPYFPFTQPFYELCELYTSYSSVNITITMGGKRGTKWGDKKWKALINNPTNNINQISIFHQKRKIYQQKSILYNKWQNFLTPVQKD